MQFDVSTNITQLCRICVRVLIEPESENMNTKPYEDLPSIKKMLCIIYPSVFSKEIEQDELGNEPFEKPRNVCSTCRQRVVDAYLLFQECVDADRKLLEIVTIQQELGNELAQDQTITVVQSVDTVRQCKTEIETVSTSKSKRKNKKWDLDGTTCKDCGKEFIYRSSLQRHMSIHSTIKTFKCEECSSEFTTKRGLMVHRLTHTKIQRFPCDECGARFTMNHSLVIHRRSHTGERPYACDVCDQKFVSSSRLTRHKRSHTGEKPYKCKVCGCGYANVTDLTVHCRIHFGDDLYQCDRCELFFQRFPELRAHYKVHLQHSKDASKELFYLTRVSAIYERAEIIAKQNQQNKRSRIASKK